MIRAVVTIRTAEQPAFIYPAIGKSTWDLYEAAQAQFPLAAISVLFKGEVRA